MPTLIPGPFKLAFPTLRPTTYSFPRVKALFEQLYNRRVQVRLVGVRYSHLVEGGCQMDLFDDVDERLELYRALDRHPKPIRRPQCG